MNNPTAHAYTELQTAYDHYNDTLFGGNLTFCLITLQRETRAYGYFSSKRFVHRFEKVTTDEIAINPSYFAVVPLLDEVGRLLVRWSRGNRGGISATPALSFCCFVHFAIVKVVVEIFGGIFIVVIDGVACVHSRLDRCGQAAWQPDTVEFLCGTFRQCRLFQGREVRYLVLAFHLLDNRQNVGFRCAFE